MRYSVGSGLGPRCNYRYIRTCCGMAAAMPWRTPATTRGRYRLGSGTRTSSTPCVTPNLRRIDLSLHSPDDALSIVHVLVSGKPRLRHDPTMRCVVGGKAAHGCAASPSSDGSLRHAVARDRQEPLYACRLVWAVD